MHRVPIVHLPVLIAVSGVSILFICYRIAWPACSISRPRPVLLTRARRALFVHAYGAHLVRLAALLWMKRSSWLEVGAITAWSLWVGRNYLDFDPTLLPEGTWNEFGTAIQPHVIWIWLRQCGLCVQWNGAINGGYPAFADLHGAQLHPLVIGATLLWGLTLGGKIAVVASLALAGLAQWWLARVLRLGLIARIWSAALVVTGGHLLGRMDQGLLAVVLSTASCSLLIPSALDLALYARRRSAILLGMLLALAIVSGQGYLQIGVLFGLAPALLVLLVNRDGTIRPLWKECLLAGGLGILLAAIFVVPLAHFWPYIQKDVDPTFGSAQPFGWTPLNLVIDDPEFYINNPALHKQPYPYLYITYISWVPVLLAILAIRLAPPPHVRVLLFFIVGIVGVYLVSSAVSLRLLARVFPNFIAGFRNPPLIAGLAVPLVVGLGAYGLDLFLKTGWPTLYVAVSESAPRPLYRPLRLAPVLLLIPLGWSLVSVYKFNQRWMETLPRDPRITSVVQALQTDTATWVEQVYGVHSWIPASLEAGLKLTTVVRPWWWADRPPPVPALQAAFRQGPLHEPRVRATLDGVDILGFPDTHYAYVARNDRMKPCGAQARGGNIDVQCTTPEAGQLIVHEYNWTGWRAYRDGQPVALQQGSWLGVEAPAGQHTYAFRYRPWDVGLGAALTLVGIGLAIWLWLRPPDLSALGLPGWEPEAPSLGDRDDE